MAAREGAGGKSFQDVRREQWGKRARKLGPAYLSAPVVHGDEIFLELHVFGNKVVVYVHLAKLVLNHNDLHTWTI